MMMASTMPFSESKRRPSFSCTSLSMESHFNSADFICSGLSGFVSSTARVKSKRPLSCVISWTGRPTDGILLKNSANRDIVQPLKTKLPPCGAAGAESSDEGRILSP